MTVPAYITDQYVFYSDVTTPAALLLDGDTQWLLPYDVLVEDVSQRDLDLLVQANGGTLPLSSESVARTLQLDNGRNWYDTYVGVTKYVVTATLPTYAEFHGDGGGGGGGGYVLPPATTVSLGGVRVPLNGGLTVSGGSLAVDSTHLPPAGTAGQVLTSNGVSGSPEWEDVNGGSF